jgi:hypothetical protein
MAVFLSPVGGVAAQFFTNTGSVLTGGKLYTYAAGTTTPQTTYTTNAGNVARTNPIILDAAGRVPDGGEIWVTVGLTYKFVLRDSNDVLIGTYDNIFGGVDSVNVVYQPAGTGAVTTNVQAKLRQTVSVKDFGAVGDGATNDSAAFLAAITASNYVEVPPGNYLITSTITIPASNKTIIGTGGVIIRGTALAAGPVITATSKNNLNYRDLVFNVQTGTPHTQDGNFVTHFSCNYITCSNNTFDASIPSAATQKESLFSAFTTFDCNYVTIQGNQFRFLFGNCCGSNSTDNGVNGHDFTIVGNVFHNCVDTTVGNWTGANAVTISGNTFVRDDYTTAYNGVFIDLAGASNITIDGNSFNGNVIGVRCLTNLSYTNKRIVVSDNVFENQTNGVSGEIAQAIKISHNDNSTGGQQSMDISILGNQFKIPANGWGIDIISTITVTTTESLTFRLDDNYFDLTAGNNTGIIFQRVSTSGALQIIPGNNNFFIGSGSVSIGGNIPIPRTIRVNGNAVTNKSLLTLTANGNVDYLRMDSGLYGFAVNSGTVVLGTGTGGQFSMVGQVVGALAETAVVDASNGTSLTTWNIVNQPDNFAITFSANGTGFSYGINYVSVYKLI